MQKSTLIFPLFSCILGPRLCGKTQLSISLVYYFQKQFPNSNIYIYSNNITEYKTNGKLLDTKNIQYYQYQYVYSNMTTPMTFNFPPSDISSNDTCLLIIDIGFINHTQQVLLHDFITCHPSVSVIICEYLWPEPILVRDLQIMCEWDSSVNEFHIYKMDRNTIVSNNTTNDDLYLIFTQKERNQWNFNINITINDLLVYFGLTQLADIFNMEETNCIIS